jgi:hypothetical protein
MKRFILRSPLHFRAKPNEYRSRQRATTPRNTQIVALCNVAYRHTNAYRAFMRVNFPTLNRPLSGHGCRKYEFCLMPAGELTQPARNLHNTTSNI